MCRRLIYLLSFALGLSIAVADAANADPSLIGWWRLDEDSGTTAYDSSGNGDHGLKHEWRAAPARSVGVNTFPMFSGNRIDRQCNIKL